mmetsp:Transcript_47057/g.109719  ORF Transcript_47057/g.109719 Transcript_47057/m.109719 type:complete len:215 (+) Transcript_47057:134-778(+)
MTMWLPSGSGSWVLTLTQESFSMSMTAPTTSATSTSSTTRSTASRTTSTSSTRRSHPANPDPDIQLCFDDNICLNNKPYHVINMIHCEDISALGASTMWAPIVRVLMERNATMGLQVFRAMYHDCVPATSWLALLLDYIVAIDLHQLGSSVSLLSMLTSPSTGSSSTNTTASSSTSTSSIAMPGAPECRMHQHDLRTAAQVCRHHPLHRPAHQR